MLVAWTRIAWTLFGIVSTILGIGFAIHKWIYPYGEEFETYGAQYVVAQTSSVQRLVLFHGGGLDGVEAIAAALRAEGYVVEVLDTGRSGELSVFINLSDDLGPFSQADLDNDALRDALAAYHERLSDDRALRGAPTGQ